MGVVQREEWNLVGHLVRSARPEDRGALRRLERLMTSAHAHGGVPTVAGSTTGRQLVRAALLSRTTVMLVVEVNNTVVGYAHARLEPLIQLRWVPRRRARARSGFLDALVVDHGHRGEGLGTALLDEVCRWAQLRGAATMDLQVFEFNEPARRLYESRGWVTVKRTMSKGLG